jgi:hypothetical protein
MWDLRHGQKRLSSSLAARALAGTQPVGFGAVRAVRMMQENPRSNVPSCRAARCHSFASAAGHSNPEIVQEN